MAKISNNFGAKVGTFVGGSVVAVLFGITALNHAIEEHAPGFKAPSHVDVSQIDKHDLKKFDEKWVAGLKTARLSHQAECLAQVIYFEARGEPVPGQLAVGRVVLNRVESPSYPNNTCAVIDQGALSGRCQFSFRCANPEPVIAEAKAYERSKKVALFLVHNPDFRMTDGALYFHAASVNPSWASDLRQTLQIGNHFFLADSDTP